MVKNLRAQKTVFKPRPWQSRVWDKSFDLHYFTPSSAQRWRVSHSFFHSTVERSPRLKVLL